MMRLFWKSSRIILIGCSLMACLRVMSPTMTPLKIIRYRLSPLCLGPLSLCCLTIMRLRKQKNSCLVAWGIYVAAILSRLMRAESRNVKRYTIQKKTGWRTANRFLCVLFYYHAVVKCPPIRPLGVLCAPVVVYGCMPNVPSLLILNSVASFAPLDDCSDHLNTELVVSVSAHAH